MSVVYSINLPYKTRCQLPDCRKPVNLVFRINVDGNPLNFCSTSHANTGESRWNEKIEKNIRMDIPPQEETQMEGDNIAELEEGGV